MNSFFRNNKTKLLLILAVVYAAITLLFPVFQQNERTIQFYIIIFFLLSIVYFSSLFVVKPGILFKNSYSKYSIRKSKSSKRIIIIFVFGMIFRTILIPADISTSDDVYRYIWEGKMMVNGYNPFEYSPGSEELKNLHSDDFPERVTFPNMTTIYFPAAQYVFAAGYLISGENDTGLKILYLVFEFFTLLFLLKLLRLKKLDEDSLILYAWLPLPVMEFFINSHIDAAGIMFFTVFLYLIEKNKIYLSAVPYAFAAMTKLYPLFFAPLLIKKLGFKKAVNFGILTFAVSFILFTPFINGIDFTDNSLLTYLQRWEFNGSLFKLLGLISDSSTARIISLVLFVSGIGLISVFHKNFISAVYWIWILFIVFASTLYPWYLTWISAVNPLLGFWSVTSLFVTSNFTNFTPLADEWHEYSWVLLVEYIPFYILLIIEIYRVIKKRNSNAG